MGKRHDLWGNFSFSSTEIAKVTVTPSEFSKLTQKAR